MRNATIPASLDVARVGTILAIILSVRCDPRLQLFHDIVEVLEIATVDSFMNFRCEANHIAGALIHPCGILGISPVLLLQ
jgi:hypothetical protein